MATSQVPMAASRMMKFSNSSLHNLIRRQLLPTATTSSATAAVGLINNSSESQLRRPFFVETPNPNQQVFPIHMEGEILYGNGIGLAAFPGVKQAPLFTRGDPIKIDDEFNDEDIDDEFNGEDADDDEDDEDADDFEDEGDFEDDSDEDDADHLNNKRKLT